MADLSDKDLQRQTEVMRLALENRARIWGYIVGLAKNPEKAEDIFQSTYLIIGRKWQDYEPGTTFIAWALRIARYEFLKSVEPRRNRYVVVEAEILEEALQAADEGRQETLSEKYDALRHCMRKLERRAVQAMTLRYEERLSCEEVARRLRMSLNAFYSLLSRVRQVLRGCVESRLRAGESLS
ncbi:MAG: sigma-70 family RNA polymerase sigma factor [Kiritimatiellae bacterium]|nr:sigma-70 family RNA polymerase sigma factor [Kiritimatiellia bacterium]